MAAGREHQSQQPNTQNKGKPSHHGLFSVSYIPQGKVRKAHLGTTTCRPLVDPLTRLLQTRGAVVKTITMGFEEGVKRA
jgi:hypothetical protein